MTNELIELNFDGFENGRYKPKIHLAQQYQHGGGGGGEKTEPGDEEGGTIKPDA